MSDSVLCTSNAAGETRAYTRMTNVPSVGKLAGPTLNTGVWNIRQKVKSICQKTRKALPFVTTNFADKTKRLRNIASADERESSLLNECKVNNYLFSMWTRHCCVRHLCTAICDESAAINYSQRGQVSSRLRVRCIYNWNCERNNQGRYVIVSRGNCDSDRCCRHGRPDHRHNLACETSTRPKL